MKNQATKDVWFIVLVGLVALLGTSPVAWGVITSNPDLPPDTGVYVSPQQVCAEYVGQDLQVIVMNIVFDPVAETAVRTQVVGVNEQEVFNSICTADFMIYIADSSIGPTATELTGSTTTITYNKWGVTTGTFDAEIVWMALSGQVSGIPFLIRENPVLSSAGQTGITDLGGGMYNIESFFDVFTELSVDGGENWISSTDSFRMELVPEPTTIGLLGLGSLALLRKRRV